MVLLTNTIVGDGNYSSPLRKDIANPGQVPDFNDFHTPTITPGSSGKLRFKITNRYNFTVTNGHESNDDNSTTNTTMTMTMTNTTLIVNIYRYSTLEESEDVQKISHSPKFTGGSSDTSGGFRDLADQWTAEFYWPRIENETVQVKLSIKSYSNTPQGRYFIRMHLNFSFNDEYFDLRSRGYFLDSQWENAQKDIPDDAEGDPNITGRLNLGVLDVDGLIPDTSIRVLKPLPSWGLYIFVIPAIIFAVLAVVFYFMDEKGKFPKTKKELDDLAKKVHDFRYRRK